MSNPTPSIADLQAALAKLTTLVEQVVSLVAPQTAVITVDESTLVALLQQVQNDSATITAALPAPSTSPVSSVETGSTTTESPAADGTSGT